MKKFLDSKLFYGILSVVMAVFLLFYVTSADNPVVEKPFNHVSIAVNGLAENQLLEAEPGYAEIRVSGYSSAVNLTFARDVRAFVDLREAKPGTAQYPVQYSLPNGLSLVHIRPETVSLTVDEQGSRELSVVCRTQNSVEEGYGSLEPEISPSTVTLTGPQRVLEQVGEVAVHLDLAGRTGDFDGYLPVELLDTEGQSFENSLVSLSEDEVNVHVAITENQSSKSVFVRAPLSGEVDEKYIVTGVEVRPASVKITGSYEAVRDIEFLTTEPVDLAALTETFHGFVRLVTPPDVEVLEGDQVEITVSIEKNLTRRVIENIPVEIRNAPEGMRYGTIPLTVGITLAAYPEVFEAVTVDGELYIGAVAYVDLEGEAADTRDYPVKIEISEEYTVEMLSNETVRLYSD